MQKAETTVATECYRKKCAVSRISLFRYIGRHISPDGLGVDKGFPHRQVSPSQQKPGAAIAAGCYRTKYAAACLPFPPHREAKSAVRRRLQRACNAPFARRPSLVPPRTAGATPSVDKTARLQGICCGSAAFQKRRAYCRRKTSQRAAAQGIFETLSAALSPRRARKRRKWRAQRPRTPRRPRRR